MFWHSIIDYESDCLSQIVLLDLILMFMVPEIRGKFYNRQGSVRRGFARRAGPFPAYYRCGCCSDLLVL